MAVALAVELEEERLAALLTVSGIDTAVADTFTLVRTSPSGSEAGVRGATNAPVTAATELVRDYELPFDTPVTYKVTVYDGGTVIGTASVDYRIDYNQCDAWLVDLARPTNSLPATIQSMSELSYDAATGVHRVLDRRTPVMTSLPAWTPAAELVILTGTLAERDQVRALYGSGFPILLRTSPEEGVGNMYLGVTGFREERFLTDGYAPERRFDADVVQVERPDPNLFVPTPPNTYANVKATWATYADMQAAVGTYDELAYTFPANPDGNPVIPWLPDDI